MKLVHIPLAIIVVGLGLIATGMLWSRVMGSGVVWTEEQAEQLSRASADMHSLIHSQMHEGEADHAGHDHHGHAGHGEEHADPEKAAADLKDARRRYQESQEALKRAKSMRSGPATFFRWSGMVLLVLGVIGFFVARALED